LRQIAASFRPDLIVHEAGELAAPLVATMLGIPNVTHGFGALVLPERVAAAAVEVAPLWEGEGLTAPPFAGCYRHLYLDIYPPSLGSGDQAHVPAVQHLRPVAFATAGDDPMPALVSAPSRDPLVYVTLGTVFNDDTRLFSTLVEGVAGLPVRVLVTVGPRGDPATLGKLPSNVEAVRYVAQTELLEHVAVVVSHAGSGTFLAALGNAIPQLCIPQAADQFANAAAGTRCGAALTLNANDVTVDRVRRAVTALLGESGFRRAAGRVQADILAMPGPEAVAGRLASLAGDRN
jgi:UDP:flavonoid glycosyltransferase YjiC (YdhE family)